MDEHDLIELNAAIAEHCTWLDENGVPRPLGGDRRPCAPAELRSLSLLAFARTPSPMPLAEAVFASLQRLCAFRERATRPARVAAARNELDEQVTSARGEDAERLLHVAPLLRLGLEDSLLERAEKAFEAFYKRAAQMGRALENAAELRVRPRRRGPLRNAVEELTRRGNQISRALVCLALHLDKRQALLATLTPASPDYRCGPAAHALVQRVSELTDEINGALAAELTVAEARRLDVALWEVAQRIYAFIADCHPSSWPPHGYAGRVDSKGWRHFRGQCSLALHQAGARVVLVDRLFPVQEAEYISVRGYNRARMRIHRAKTRSPNE